MAAWTHDEFASIGAADELERAVSWRDGTLRTPATIWVAHSGDDLYVRSVNGRAAAWC